MDNATPPSPVKLKTSSSVFSSFPSGTAQEIYNLSSIATHCKQKKTNTTTETFVKTTKKILLEINAGRRKMKNYKLESHHGPQSPYFANTLTKHRNPY